MPKQKRIAILAQLLNLSQPVRAAAFNLTLNFINLTSAVLLHGLLDHSHGLLLTFLWRGGRVIAKHWKMLRGRPFGRVLVELESAQSIVGAVRRVAGVGDHRIRVRSVAGAVQIERVEIVKTYQIVWVLSFAESVRLIHVHDHLWFIGQAGLRVDRGLADVKIRLRKLNELAVFGGRWCVARFTRRSTSTVDIANSQLAILIELIVVL